MKLRNFYKDMTKLSLIRADTNMKIILKQVQEKQK